MKYVISISKIRPFENDLFFISFKLKLFKITMMVTQTNNVFEYTLYDNVL